MEGTILLKYLKICLDTGSENNFGSSKLPQTLVKLQSFNILV